MATTAQRMDALEAALARIERALVATSRPRKGTAKSTVKVHRETPAELRARGAAGTCDAHDGTCGKNKDGRFATANGRAYHESHGGHFA